MDYRTITTVKLVDMIAMAAHKGDQETVNAIALELTKRIWVPNAETTFEQMLYDFGYRSEKLKIRK